MRRGFNQGGIKKTKKLDDEKLAVTIGAFIGIVATIIGFMKGSSINTCIMIFIVVWIFGSIFILLANVAYLDLKDRKKNKRKK